MGTHTHTHTHTHTKFKMTPGQRQISVILSVDSKVTCKQVGVKVSESLLKLLRL